MRARAISITGLLGREEASGKHYTDQRDKRGFGGWTEILEWCEL